MNLKMNNYFCNYVLTLKQLKDRFLWRGGRGVKTPLGRYPFKKGVRRGSSPRAAFFGRGGEGGSTAYGVVSH